MILESSGDEEDYSFELQNFELKFFGRAFTLGDLLI